MESQHRRYKRYDEEFKRNAVDLLETSGRPMAELADELGVPYKTLERWRSVYRRDRSMPPGKPPVAKASPESSRAR